MAFVQATFYSPALRKQTSMYLIVPEKGDGPFAVFYLLHGFSDDHTIWMRRTRIDAYVEGLPLIIAMPDGYHGFYTDNHAGDPYGKYMTEDVIGFVERSFNVQKNRGGRCIGGLSMGGYGSLRLALSAPEMFISANSHSGAAQPWFPKDPECYKKDPERGRIFGPNPAGTQHDLYHLAKRLKRSGKPIPKLLIDCGSEDFLFEQNREMHAEFEKIGIPHEYREFLGNHNWDYWDEHIRESLEFHCKALKIKRT
jgi:putative tributyrin esterase